MNYKGKGKCSCECNCGCKEKCEYYSCTMDEIYNFLGKEIYCILKDLPVPCDHPSLAESLCLLLNGKALPPGHPTLEQLLCKALNCKHPKC